MAITPIALVAGAVLGSATAPLYTVPAGLHAKVGSSVFTNSTAGALNFSITITRNGGAAEVLISQQPLYPNQAYVSPELPGLVLNPGDVISGFSNVAASVNVQISGLTF